MEPSVGDDVRPPAEYFLEFELKLHKIEQGLAVLELHEEIHVAVFPVIAAHYRSKHARPHYTMPSERGHYALADRLDRFHMGPNANDVAHDTSRRRHFKVRRSGDLVNRSLATRADQFQLRPAVLSDAGEEERRHVGDEELEDVPRVAIAVVLLTDHHAFHVAPCGFDEASPERRERSQRTPP
jgi:hypothetical protein